jgi:5'-nucleotidase
MSLLYGLDIAAKARWGDAVPDLVLSGPNEGQNVGRIINSSGTVSIAQYAAWRGLSAIALSAGHTTRDDGGLAAPDSAKVAQLSLQLVLKLAERSGNAPLLPQNLALNVNFPDKLEGAKWRWSRIGTYDLYNVRFRANVSSSPLARGAGDGVQTGLGIAAGNEETKPVKSQMNDEAVVFRTDIAVSPMQVGFEARQGQERLLSRKLKGLLER